MKSELSKIIKKGESQNLEFKINLENIGKSICSFANTNDGVILVGVDDKGKIAGTKKKFEREIANIAHTCKPSVYPDIKESKVNNKIILIVKVKKSDSLHSYKNVAYKRVGSHDKPLSPEEVINFAKETGKIKFDEQVCEGTTLKELLKKHIGFYLKEREIHRKISSKLDIPLNQMLENIGAVKESRPTNAGIMFFGKNPQRFIRNFELRLVVFKGNNVTMPTVDSLICIGTLPEMIREAETFLRKSIRLLGRRTSESFTRVDKFEYPIEALREAIINALIHRNYFESGDVRVFIFEDRVEIMNPGKFPEGVTPDKPIHKPVNEILARLTYDTGKIEKYGSGIAMIKRFCRENGNPKPKYELSKIETKVIFQKAVERVTEKVTEKVTENQRKILNLIGSNSNITIKYLSVKINISEKSIKENISKLKKKGLLKRIGPAKGGYWKINETNHDKKYVKR